MEIRIFSYFLYFFVFLLGLSLGSFFNSWIWRHFENIRVVNGRSICIHCRRQLKWWENIPLFSFVFLRGRCYTCKKPISWRYPLLEISAALVLVFIYYYHTNYLGFNPVLFFRDVIFIGLLLVIFTYDSAYKIIPSELVWAGIVLGGIINLFFLKYSFVNLALGALVAGGFFLVQYLISGGRWIGGGDVRMGFMMGIWLGWKQVLVALLIAYVVGAAVALILIILKKKSWAQEIPFGTFLSFGTFVSLYFGQNILDWYLGLIKF